MFPLLFHDNPELLIEVYQFGRRNLRRHATANHSDDSLIFNFSPSFVDPKSYSLLDRIELIPMEIVVIDLFLLQLF